MIKRIFSSSSTIASAAIVLGLAGLFSRLLGVYRDRLLATTFGADAVLDAYYAAFRFPDLIFNLLVLGALSAGFIPVFSSYLSKSKKEAFDLAFSVFATLLVSLILLCAFAFVLMPLLVPLLAPGFSSSTTDLTVSMSRVMLLSPILLGMSGVFGGVLQSYKRFFAYAFAPILYNAGIITGIFIFVPSFGPLGLAYGVLLGSVVHLILQYIVVKDLGWHWGKWNFWKTKGLKEILALMGPRTAALFITQINLFVITIFASRLVEGRLAIFNLAQNLAHVPIGLFGVSFAIAAFPVLTQAVDQNKHQKFVSTIAKTLIHICFFLFPTMIIFALLDEQIVRLVLGAGEFDWPSTLLTAKTLLYFLPGILAQSLLPLFARSFYAKKNTSYPFMASIGAFVSTIVFAYLLVPSFDIVGLAFAYSLASLVQLLFLILILYLQEQGTIKRAWIHSIYQMAFASILMLISVQLVKHFTGPFLDLLTVKGVLVHFILPASIGALTYLGTLRTLKSQEYADFEDAFMKKIKQLTRTAIPAESTAVEDDFFDN